MDRSSFGRSCRVSGSPVLETEPRSSVIHSKPHPIPLRQDDPRGPAAGISRGAQASSRLGRPANPRVSLRTKARLPGPPGAVFLEAPPLWRCPADRPSRGWARKMDRGRWPRERPLVSLDLPQFARRRIPAESRIKPLPRIGIPRRGSPDPPRAAPVSGVPMPFAAGRRLLPDWPFRAGPDSFDGFGGGAAPGPNVRDEKVKAFDPRVG